MSATKKRPMAATQKNGNGRPPDGLTKRSLKAGKGFPLRGRLVYTGRTPLLMNNKRLSDPEDPYTRELAELTAVPGRDRTDADRKAIARANFEGALYFDDGLGPFVPGEWIMGNLRDAGVLAGRLGKKVGQGIALDLVRVPLEYAGPRTIDGLWRECFYLTRSVTQGQNRVPRTRPCFEQWRLDFGFTFLDDVLDLGKLSRIVAKAGVVGIGDGRPKNKPGIGTGRFTAELWTEEGS